MCDQTKSESKPENLRVAYQQVCTSYHAIDGFRGTLLGLLPLASGAGILLLVNNAQVDPKQMGLVAQYATPIGIFGLIVTLGLFFYELNGIRRCNSLINAGQKIEKDLNAAGPFLYYPKDVAGFIGPPLAARLIYPSVLAAWLFVALVFAVGQVISGIFSIVMFIGIIVWSFQLDLGHPNLGQCE